MNRKSAPIMLALVGALALGCAGCGQSPNGTQQQPEPGSTAQMPPSANTAAHPGSNGTAGRPASGSTPSG
ncbi:MAG: hypothetical protein EPN40_05550 [Rhodanobacteraceae bacterium]|nr:MAG: hypothetical protein EPN40_05550 [Rhodanobacteraceae bacterium]